MAGIISLLFIIAILTTMIVMKMRQNKGAFMTYLIPRGNHYSLNEDTFTSLPFKLKLSKHSIRFEAIFVTGCDYDDSKMGNDKSDINKLYGISYGFDPHYRSVRIGWRYNSNLKVIGVYVYSYVKGKRKTTWLLDVKLFEAVELAILKDDKHNTVYVQAKIKDQGYTVEKAIEGIDKSWINFRLWPYFGGDQTAPNDMRIMIKDIK